MFKKKTGVKIMAVILAAAIAMPSAGTALAAGQESVRQETEDSGGTWWEKLLHGLYVGSEREGENKSTATSTNTNTNTSTGPLLYAVSLKIELGNSNITYGDDVKGNIKVSANPVNGDITQEDLDAGFGENDYLLKYYEKEGAQYRELPEAPKDAGEYAVQAYSLEESKYKSKGSEKVDFSIAKKEITIKPVDREMGIDDFENNAFPEKWAVELAEGSELAYDEELSANYEEACEVKNGDVTVSEPEAGEYDLVITGTPTLSLAGGAKAENYEVTSEKGKLTIGKKLDLQVEAKEFIYGEFNKAGFHVTAEDNGESVNLVGSRLSFQFFDEDGSAEIDEKDLREAGTYQVVVKYAYADEDHYLGESGKVTFTIAKRPITVKVEEFEIENGAELPGEDSLKMDIDIGDTEGLDVNEAGLLYDDGWKVAPRAEYEKKDIDTTVAGGYTILVRGELEDDCIGNYDLPEQEDGTIGCGTMTVKAVSGEEKEIELKLDAVSVVYGENIGDAVIGQITATEVDGGAEAILPKNDQDLWVLSYYGSDQTPIGNSPAEVGAFFVKARFKGNGAYKSAETGLVALTVTARTITIEAESYQIANGAALPEAQLKAHENLLSYEDKWAEGGEPKAAYKDEVIDTKTGGEYEITVSAKVEEAKEKNYNLELRSGWLSVAKLGESGKSLDELDIKEEVPRRKVYDGKPFVITKDSVRSKFGYTGEYEFVWRDSDGTVLESAPKDAGKYTLTISIPESDSTWEGSGDFTIEIEQKTVTAQAVVTAAKAETFAGELFRDFRIDSVGFVEVEGKLEGWIREPVVKVVAGDVNKEGGSYQVQAADGDAGANYHVTYGDAVTITVSKERKPLISALEVKKPKNKNYIYSGEQICPTVTVKYERKKLKLNVDYVVDYSDNVNAGKAIVTVRGIGEYAGYLTDEFVIDPKDMKTVTLSEVGTVKMGDGDLESNLREALVVMDGNYEVPEDDYEIRVATQKGGSFVPLSEVNCGDSDIFDKAELKVFAVNKEGNNYTGESRKKAKLVILGKDVNATPIAEIGFSESCLRMPAKGYTYNGKAQKPKVKITGVKSGSFKVVYKNNVNAGEKTGEVRVVGVYNKKKGTGYYGVSDPVNFTIKQKSISKVKVSAGTAIPKNGNRDDIKLTVKDGKRVLMKDVDYTVTFDNDSNVFDGDQIKSDIQAGSKINVKIVALGGNYEEGSSKNAVVKFGQLNLASKTAKVDVSMTGSNASDVTVIYNGVELVQGTDYTVSKIKQGKDGKYTITIKAVKGKSCVYKGSKTVKSIEIKTTTEQ